jgi:hypothetical protein
MRGDRDLPPHWRRDQRDLNIPATDIFRSERGSRGRIPYWGCRQEGRIRRPSIAPLPTVRACISPGGRLCRRGDAIPPRHPILPPAPCGRRDCKHRRARCDRFFVRRGVQARGGARQWQGLRRCRGKTEHQHAGRRHRGKSRHCFLLRHPLSARLAENGLRWRAAPQALMQINRAPSRGVPRDHADPGVQVHGACDLHHIEFHKSRLMWWQSIRS